MMSAQLQQQANAAVAAGRVDEATVSSQASTEPQAVDEKPSEPVASTLQNRAGESQSPYIQSHEDTPVSWQLLDDDAVALAKAQNKLIFMNIGFKACHYCRLTTRESFRNEAVASLLNSSFIPIIVDREERPDIDSIYMNYIQAVNSDGGWPLNLFLTPELEPVFGGTYWPGPGRGNSSAVDDGEEPLDFLGILNKLHSVWTEQEAKCRKEAQDIVLQLQEFAAEGTFGPANAERTTPIVAAVMADCTSIEDPAPNSSTGGLPQPTASSPATDLDVDLDQLEEAYANISRTFDRINGGFNLTPKFPTPPKLSFLLRLAHLPSEVGDIVGGPEEVAQATQMALQTLRALRDGGLRDHIGAGFHRYSVTVDWSVPRFEKMVADNALLLGVYVDAWLGQAAQEGRLPTLEDEFADVVLELGDYLGNPASELRRSLTQSSLLATSVASDSYPRRSDKHMREGAYYLWTRREFDATVSGRGDGELPDGNQDGDLHARVAAAYWNVKEHGNIPEKQDPNDEFINQNVLRVVKTPAELSASFGIATHEINQILAEAKTKLKAWREKDRVPPEVDDKHVVAYNAMAISALARAGVVLQSTGLDKDRGGMWILSAQNAARDIKGSLWDQNTGVLSRHWFKDQKSHTDALAEDYAFLIEAMLDLYEATGKGGDYLLWAQQLQDKQIELFYDHASPPGQTLALEARNLVTSGSGGFYSTPEGAPHVILRLKDGMDTSQPSTNAVSASNLFRLALTCDSFEDQVDGVKVARKYNYDILARETIKAFEVEMLQYPFLFTGLLMSVVSARLGGQAKFVEASEQLYAGGVADTTARDFACKPRGGLRSLCVKAKSLPLKESDDAVSGPQESGPSVPVITDGVSQLTTSDQ